MSLAQQCFDLLFAHRLKLVTAESCTGGMLAAAITDLAGSSDIFERGFVTYSNAAKTEELGVDHELITQFGAVCEKVALAMAQGALTNSAADISLAVTGIAGPGGGSAEKPVGLVWFAVATHKNLVSKVCHFGNLSRSEIRAKSVETAFQMLIDQVKREL
jgi:nicotinamide-nucleotide amidase